MLASADGYSAIPRERREVGQQNGAGWLGTVKSGDITEVRLPMPAHHPGL